MAHTEWTFVLARSNDLSTIAPLYKAQDKSISLTLNRPGNLSFTLAMTDEFANQIHPLVSAIKAYRKSAEGIVKLIWSGYVITIEEDISNNRMNVACVGWIERLSKRYLRREKTYTAMDDADIIFDLLAEANLTAAPDGYTIPIPTSSNPATPTWIQAGTTLPNEGVGGGTPYIATTRDRKLEKRTSIGATIQEFSDLENGCDLEVDPETRALNIYRKKMEVRPDIVFGFNWGPSNVGQFGSQIDSSILVNYHLSIGKETAIPQYADDTESQDTFGLIEEIANLSDVSDTTVLYTYSASEVAIRAQPLRVFTLVPFPYMPGSGVPEPFVDYDVGDKVYLTANWGERINIVNLALRVFGVSMNIDENGNERPGPLQLAP